MNTITCLEITKFVLEEPGVVPSSLSSNLVANDLRYLACHVASLNMSLMFLSVVYDTALSLKTHETYILFEVRKLVRSCIRAI